MSESTAPNEPAETSDLARISDAELREELRSAIDGPYEHLVAVLRETGERGRKAAFTQWALDASRLTKATTSSA
jgi:hypothetical protein